MAIVLYIFIYLELPTYLVIFVFLICYYFSILLSRTFPLIFSIYLFSWLCLRTCEILVPRPGIEPKLMAVKALVPNHWTSGELPFLFNKYPSLLFFNLICSWKISDFVFSVLLFSFFFDPRKLPKGKTNRETVLLKISLSLLNLLQGKKKWTWKGSKFILIFAL